MQAIDNKFIRWGILGCGEVTDVKSDPALDLIVRSSLETVMCCWGISLDRAFVLSQAFHRAVACISENQPTGVYYE
ncbi:hypothetical protein N9O61_03100 [Octadecabacter sp.]|nr:hypothetical protein [Octadecabacter sp.]